MKLPETVVLNKNDLKILTPFGHEDFYGINKVEKDEYIHLTFTDDRELKCSLDHPIQTIEGIIKAKDLDKTTEVFTKNGGCFVKNKKIIKKKIDLYDIVNSGKHHLYYTNDIVSHNCEFLGSVDTLISGAKLASLVQERPIKSNSGLDIYEDPIEGHNYAITVDVARGVDLDYSAFVIFDITQLPYKIVGKYKNNEIKPMIFPYVIRDTANAYNNSYILCEINDVGDQVANALHYEMECINVLMCFQRGRAGQTVGQGFSGRKAQMGVKMSKNTKKVGCINLKAILEEEKLIIHDYDIIQELTTFVQKSNSFEAEEGAHDDLTMCLVIFSWLVTQDYFKEMTDNDVRKRLYEDQQKQLEQDMAPFGFILNGVEDEDQITEDDGTVWHTDEYGDVSHLWTSYSF
jgi:hypothetical protein